MISRKIFIKNFVENAMFYNTEIFSDKDCIDEVIWFIDPSFKFKLIKAHLGEISSLTISPDNSFLATGSVDKSIIIWYLPSLEKFRILREHHGWVLSLAWDPKSRYLASGGSDGSIFIWDILLGEIVWELYYHGDSVHGLAWSPDGKYLASGGLDSKVYIFDIVNRKTLTSLSLPSSVTDVKWNPRVEVLAIASMDGNVYLYDLNDDNITKLPMFHSLGVRKLDWNNDGTLLVSIGFDRRLHVWDLKLNKVIHTVNSDKGDILDVKFSPDSKKIAFSTSIGEIKIFSEGKIRETLQLFSKLGVLSWSKDSKRILVGASNGNMYLVWDFAK